MKGWSLVFRVGVALLGSRLSNGRVGSGLESIPWILMVETLWTKEAVSERVLFEFRVVRWYI